MRGGVAPHFWLVSPRVFLIQCLVRGVATRPVVFIVISVVMPLRCIRRTFGQRSDREQPLNEAARGV